MRHRGWILLECMAAVVLIGILLGATAIAITGQRRVGVRTAELRTAIESAERAAVAIRSGTPVPDMPGVSVRVDPLEVDGRAWIRVTATAGERSASLHVLLEGTP